ncbi:NAD(P)/FAD-dependent oxidoreductase [Patescibacteria group bacterium]|nr:NAD(P)/FAD-dependent oxidoreductase [Patescibacteria group bacterium]
MKMFDIIVVGAGPAGLMAAGRAAELGAKVLLLEKNKQPGVKLLMSGGGRCNFTNLSTANLFAETVGSNGKWLLSALKYFGPQEVIDFFQERGLTTKIEDNNRVFPDSDKASDVLNILLAYNHANGVKMQVQASVVKIISAHNKITHLILKDGKKVQGKKYIIAVGGSSYPHSGSSGDAYNWLKSLGHSMIQARPALGQIYLKGAPYMLEGLSLENVSLSLYKESRLIDKEEASIMFTAKGLSGPAAINLSRKISLLPNDSLSLKLDCFPNEKSDFLDKRLQKIITANQRLDLKNIIAHIIPKRLTDYYLGLLDISPNKKGSEFNHSERLALVDLLKNKAMLISGLADFNEAMLTVGGVDLKEVEAKTMASKNISNLYFAGECLDLDGPTGGYNLQIAWATGYVAGESAAEALS